MLTTLVVVLVGMVLMAVGAGVLLGIVLYGAVMAALLGLLVLLAIAYLVYRWRSRGATSSEPEGDGSMTTRGPA